MISFPRTFGRAHSKECPGKFCYTDIDSENIIQILKIGTDAGVVVLIKYYLKTLTNFDKIEEIECKVQSNG